MNSESKCPFGAPIIDYFDHNSPEYGRNRFEWFKAIREQVGNVFWTPNNGGFWVVIGWNELTEAAKNWEIFSSKGPMARAEPEKHGDLKFQGLFAPPRPDSALMLEEDPPDWNKSRKALTPFFNMQSANTWRQRFRDLTNACIDRHIESGHIDFARDLSSIVPTVFSLELAGVETDDYAEISQAYHLTSHMTPLDPGWDEALVTLDKLNQRILASIAAMKARPPAERGTSLIATLLNANEQQDAEVTHFSEAEIFSLAVLTIAAGIDTTSATLGSTFVILSQRPDLRRQLMEDRSRITDAFHEFIRITTPTAGLLRTVTQDTELGGQHLRRGDRAMLCFAAASRDPAEFENAEEIVINRKPNRHVGFGTGIHRCLGANFAQVEFEELLATVLERMPDFQVDVERSEIYENIGIVAGWKTIPATFTPAKTSGVDPRIPGW